MDGVYYYHIYLQGKHYAVCHRFTIPDDTKRITISNDDGETICMFFGYQVDSFDGIEKWEELYSELCEKYPDISR